MTSTETPVKNVTTRADIVSDADLERIEQIAAGKSRAARFARMSVGLIREDLPRGRKAAQAILDSGKKLAEIDETLDSDEPSDSAEVNAYRKIAKAYDALAAKREAAIEAAAKAWDDEYGEKLTNGETTRDNARETARKALTGSLVSDETFATYKDVVDFVKDAVSSINSRLDEGEEPIVVMTGAKVGAKAKGGSNAAKGEGWRPKLAVAKVDGEDVFEDRDGKVVRTFTILASKVKGVTARALQDAFVAQVGSREKFEEGAEHTVTLTVNGKPVKITAQYKA